MAAKNKLIYTSTEGMTPEEWLGFRKQGIGASEVGYIMGLSPYKSKLELFYEKITPNVIISEDSIPAFMGKFMEEHIATMWQYWQEGGDQLDMQKNFREKRKIRSMQRVNAYIQNPKYPWLFVSLDRRINKYDDRGNGCLEIKTIGGFEADKWEGGIPPYHVVQVNTQMLVTGWKFGELAIFKDGRYLDVYPFEPHRGIRKEIVKQTFDFYERVKRGRTLITQKYVYEKNFNTAKVREVEAELMRLEPDPDGSEALANFLKEKYLNPDPVSERPGTLEEYEIAKKHLQLKAQQRELNNGILLAENTLKNNMKNTECITFGTGGRLYWKQDSGGSRRFMNKIVL